MVVIEEFKRNFLADFLIFFPHILDPEGRCLHNYPEGQKLWNETVLVFQVIPDLEDEILIFASAGPIEQFVLRP
jgi:hypothetical protein